jgi:hypothetical protein
LAKDISEKLKELRYIVAGTDELIPNGQTNIKDSLCLINKYPETLEGE